MSVCVSGETGWEKLPIRLGDLVPCVRPATAAPAGEISAHQTQRDSRVINTAVTNTTAASEDT